MTRRCAEFDPEVFSAVLQPQAIKRIDKPEEALAALYLSF
jgi:hypothetical protein